MIPVINRDSPRGAFPVLRQPFRARIPRRPYLTGASIAPRDYAVLWSREAPSHTWVPFCPCENQPRTPKMLVRRGPALRANSAAGPLVKRGDLRNSNNAQSGARRIPPRPAVREYKKRGNLPKSLFFKGRSQKMFGFQRAKPLK